MKFLNAGEIAAWRLCLGCGACAWACPEKGIQLTDIIDDGIRPVVTACTGCSRCVQVCPGVDQSRAGQPDDGAEAALLKSWGPVLGVWEGHATDPDIRFTGSSGGAATALALYCMEREGMFAAIHAGADKDEPWRNRTKMSRRRDELLANSGSRYSPASPCDGLGTMETAPSPCVFLGKPCDVAGLRRAQAMSPELAARAGLAISIFCAGTPSTRGTLDLLSRLDKKADEVESMRYRGHGWPGDFSAHCASGEAKLSYREAWSFLQKYRPLRCHLCPDGTGESADISCGDPWYKEVKNGEPGLTLIVARTQKGRRILEGAVKAGYLKMKPLSPDHLQRSQENLFKKRQMIWGRLLALRLILVPAPRLRGFNIFSNWFSLPLREKLKSIGGTLKRAFKRGYYRKAVIRNAFTAMKDISIIRKRGII